MITVYKYQLMLNYDESNWEVDEWFHIQEADYKRVDAFQILRLNFYYHGEEFDVPVKMDTISGETKKIYNRDLVLDTSSTIWKFKEVTGDVTDTIVDTTDKVIDGAGDIFNSIVDTVTNPTGTTLGKTLLIGGGCVLGVFALYYLYKFGTLIVHVFKKKE